jgi:hypothetical protein
MKENINVCGFEKGISGWLSPEGGLYRCPYYMHINTALKIEEEKKIPSQYDINKRILHGEELLKKLGYIKFINSDNTKNADMNSFVFFPDDYFYSHNKKVTKEQMIWIENNLDKLSENQIKIIYEKLYTYVKEG